MHICEVKALALTFKGGIRIDGYKNTKKCRVEKLPDTELVSISMRQHIGEPAVPTVKEGEYVAFGQRIGEVTEGLGVPIHSSVSGVVRAVNEETASDGIGYFSVVIENDKKYQLSESIKPYTGILAETSTETIIDIVKNAGIVGLGGDAYPTYARLGEAVGRVNKVIINCCESDPFITTAHRLLLEDPASVINGTKIILKALGVREAVIAIEDNKLDAVNTIEKLLSSSKMIKVRVLKTKYPQGNDDRLIYALTGKTVSDGKSPFDIGYAVFDPETVAAVFNAFSSGMPLVSRRITVSGDCVKKPKNLLVPIGAPYSEIIDFCGGLKRTPEKLIKGGAMTGEAQISSAGYVTKDTTALLLLSERLRKRSSMPPACIRCGACAKVCPSKLMPNYIAAYADIMELSKAEELGAMSCTECGLCSYVCPGLCETAERIRSVKKFIASDREYTAREE